MSFMQKDVYQMCNSYETSVKSFQTQYTDASKIQTYSIWNL